MFEKLKEYGLYIILGLIALGALAYAYVQTSNSQKGAEIESANLDAMTIAMSRSDKLKKNSTVAEDLLNANGGKTIGKYKVDNSKVSYVIGETYSDIFDNKKMMDISSDLSDIEEGQLRTILIAQPAISVNGDDTINTVNLNSDKSLTVGTNTISQENLDEVADELKGYNVGAIGFATFSTEQEAKDFRDTYFSSYEVYEIGNTGNFVVLKEYNQGGESTSIQGKITTTSNLDGTGGEEQGTDICNEYICLDTNGITLKAKEETVCGQEYEFQGNNYYVACNKNDLKDKIVETYNRVRDSVNNVSNQVVDHARTYHANQVITTKVTDMSFLFSNEINQLNNESMPDEFGNCMEQYRNVSGNLQWGEVGINTIGIDSWDTSNVTNMRFMFADSMSDLTANISNWNTSNVTNMSYMFCGSGFNGNIGNWNVSNVTNMSGMFDGATRFNNGGSDSIKNWNVSNVTNMSEMFYGAGSFNQPIGTWNVSNVEKVRIMFNDAIGFSQDLSSWSFDSADTGRWEDFWYIWTKTQEYCDDRNDGGYVRSDQGIICYPWSAEQQPNYPNH